MCSDTMTDRVFITLDMMLRTMFAEPESTGRPTPGGPTPGQSLAQAAFEGGMTAAEREETGRLMRVNHAGEVCAQALYLGQALVAQDKDTRTLLEQSAREEGDHLAWTSERVREMGGHTSQLNPFWFLGALAIGAAAAQISDKASLGFLAETERQVVAHIDRHLARLPAADTKSRAILVQMRIDEGEHAAKALAAGGTELSGPVKGLMRLASKVMTGTAYYV